MRKLSGKTSRRIRDGRIPADAVSNRRLPVDDQPKTWAVRAARGFSLGAGHKRDGTAGMGIRD